MTAGLDGAVAMFEVWQEEEEEEEQSAEDMGALTGARWKKNQFPLFNYLFYKKLQKIDQRGERLQRAEEKRD